ncbi:MAG: hypothetical protein M2R45_00660 [Verrucomicrobia subdivision 3 bacterium]|nr:hypothetical protein [Limisphaerales bacterium]MCS1414457.1 hypothetical protein [Limisphaerales bacterium]
MDGNFNMERVADIVPMLLLLLTLTVSAFICFLSTLYYLRNRHASALVSHPGFRDVMFSSKSTAPWFVFDRPRCWLAIRSRNLSEVQAALGLTNSVPCSWMKGLVEAMAANRLFVSPPISGWILVFGPHLPTPSDDIDQCFRFVTNLSAELGEVQYFCGDSVTYEHAWARVIDGMVVRGYAWYQETLWNQGVFSEAERKTGMDTFDYGESMDASAYDAQELYRKNTERLFDLAGRWSVDLSRISRAELMASGLGLSGDMFRAKIF